MHLSLGKFQGFRGYLPGGRTKSDLFFQGKFLISTAYLSNFLDLC